MVHISPWEATEGLMRGAGRLLPSGSPLYLYGPYIRADTDTAPSNRAFDEALRRQNPDWALRHVDDVRALALRNGLAFDRIVEMPANNISLIFRKISLCLARIFQSPVAFAPGDVKPARHTP